MKRAIGLVAFLAFALAGTLTFLRNGRAPFHDAPSAVAATPEPEAAVVGPGRVEPASEEVRVSAEIEGRLAEVRVDEGSRVRKGDLLARIENSDYQARVDLAEADLTAREAERARVLNGARAEERREAGAAVKEAEATLANARAELSRYRALYADRLTAREQVDTRETAVSTAEARLEAARHHQALVEADARVEDSRRADAQVQLARARLAEARSLLDKTTIHAPIAGVVLRRHYKTGETVAPGAAIVTMGDVAHLRVRMELDERDVGRIHVGQTAFCKADAFPGRRFSGKIVRIGQMLGRKNIRTDDPAERADTRVLEALIDLDAGAPFPPGLRVDVFVPSP
jgi:HlyD family secretion protein